MGKGQEAIKEPMQFAGGGGFEGRGLGIVVEQSGRGEGVSKGGWEMSRNEMCI